MGFNGNKWDKLYDPNKKTIVVTLEEKAKKSYFDNVFEKAILDAWEAKNGSILEPGCGSGTVSAMLSIRGNDVTIMDLSKNAVNRARSKFHEMSTQCNFSVGDLFNMPFKDNNFDLIFNQGVMEHFELAGLDPSIAIKEMLRILKKDGTIVILVPAFLSPLHIVYFILKSLRLLDKLWPYEKQDSLHKNDLYEMIKGGGGQNIKIKRIPSSLFFSMIGWCKKK